MSDRYVEEGRKKRNKEKYVNVVINKIEKKTNNIFVFFQKKFTFLNGLEERNSTKKIKLLVPTHFFYCLFVKTLEFLLQTIFQVYFIIVLKLSIQSQHDIIE